MRGEPEPDRLFCHLLDQASFAHARVGAHAEHAAMPAPLALFQVQGDDAELSDASDEGVRALHVVRRHEAIGAFTRGPMTCLGDELEVGALTEHAHYGVGDDDLPRPSA